MYSKILALRFPRRVVNEPIVMNLVKDYNLRFNILKATIYPRKEGFMVLEVSGQRKDYQKGVRYLRSCGVKVEYVAQDVRRDENRCFQCGACTAVCPTGALHIQRPEMAVLFDKEKCSACELCVPACPARAMEVRVDKGALA